MGKHVKHMYSAGLAKPVKCPWVQFAVLFTSDSGKERRSLWLELEEDEGGRPIVREWKSERERERDPN